MNGVNLIQKKSEVMRATFPTTFDQECLKKVEELYTRFSKRGFIPLTKKLEEVATYSEFDVFCSSYC